MLRRAYGEESVKSRWSTGVSVKPRIWRAINSGEAVVRKGNHRHLWHQHKDSTAIKRMEDALEAESDPLRTRITRGRSKITNSLSTSVSRRRLTTTFSLRSSRCQRLHSVLGYQTPRQYEAEFNPVIDRTTSSRQALDAGPEDRALRGRSSSAGQFRRTAALPEQA
jgi:hypothetical protein